LAWFIPVLSYQSGSVIAVS